MADKDLKYRIDADDGPLGSALTRAGLQLGQFNSRMDSMFTGMSGNFQRVAGIFGGLVTLLGGAGLVAGMRNAIDMQDQMSESATRFGLSTEAFSEYAYAAKLSGLEVGDLGKAIAKTSGLLVDAQQGQKSAVELFQRLKLDPKGIKDTDQLLQSLAERFSQMPDGVQKTSLAIDIFGDKLGPKMVPLLNDGTAGLAAMREEARQLGVVVSTEAGQAAEQFNDNLDRLGSVGQGAFQQLSAAALPTLNAITEALLESQKEGGMLSQVLDVAGKAVRIVFETLAVLAANGAYMLKAVGREIGAVAAQAVALATLDIDGFNAISEAVKEDARVARAELTALEQRIFNFGRREAGGGRGFVNPAAVVPDQSGFTPGGKVPTPGKPTAEAKQPDSYMQTYTAVLDGLKLRYAQENDLREMSKAQEIAYWREVLATYQVTTKDRLDITKRMAQLELASLRETAQQRGQIDQLVRDRAESAALGAVDTAQQAARAAYDQQVLTYADLLVQEQGFEEQRLEIRRTYLQARLAQIDPERDPVAYQQILLQLETLERGHALRIAQIKAESLVQTKGQFDGLFAVFDSSLQSITQSIVNRTFTWRSAFQSVLGSISQGAMRTISTIATNWVKGLLQMQSAEKSMTLASIHANASKAGAAAYQAVVGIPVVGPFLAPAAAAVAYAGTMAFASAEGGYDIPAGVNPMTQLHQREMVLPAPLADAVRRMAGDPSAGGGQAQSPAAMLNATPLPGGFWVAQESEFVRFFGDLQRDRKINP